MSKFLENQIIMAKIESTYGTDSVPAGADALVVQDLSWSIADARLVERNVSTGSKLSAPRIYAGSLMELTFKMELKGSGTVDVPPEAGPILQACGFLETVNAATSVVYSADSDDESSVSIYFDDDGDEWQLVGCRGSVKFTVAAGAVGLAEVTLKGRVSQYPTASGGFTPVYDATIPVPLLNVPLTFGGVSVEQGEFSIDNESTLVNPPVLNNANGYGEIRISRRAPKLSLTAYPANVAGGFDPIGDLVAGTTKTLSMPVVGSVAGNQWQMTMPGGCLVTDISPGDDEGLVTYEVTADLLATAIGADDELSLTFT